MVAVVMGAVTEYSVMVVTAAVVVAVSLMVVVGVVAVVILDRQVRTGRRFGGSVTNRRADWSWALLKEPTELYEEAQEVRTGRTGSVPVEPSSELVAYRANRQRTGSEPGEPV